MYSIPNPHLVGWHASWVSWLCCTFYIFTRATLASTGINCHHMSVCPSVTSRCSSETDKCRITQTMPDNSPGTLVFWYWKSRQHSNGVTPSGGAKCRWSTCGSWKLATFDAKHCQLRFGHKFITLSIHLICLQHVPHDAAPCVGLSATADPCHILLGCGCVMYKHSSPVTQFRRVACSYDVVV